MTKTFTAQLEDFAKMTVEAMEYTMRQSIQDVLEAAQTTQIGIGQGATSFEVGKIPVDTAELVNSLTVDGATGPDSYVTAIEGMEIGDVKRFAWTAPHALPVEMGTSKFPGRHFVSANARRFSEFVDARAAEVKR